MNKIILTIVCFFCLSLISNLAVADKTEWVEMSDWLEAKKLTEQKEEELRKTESALNNAKKHAEQKENELRKAESLIKVRKTWIIR